MNTRAFCAYCQCGQDHRSMSASARMSHGAVWRLVPFPSDVQRHSQHRQLKGGELGYEDEKFSYLVAAKAGELQPDALDGDGLRRAVRPRRASCDIPGSIAATFNFHCVIAR